MKTLIIISLIFSAAVMAKTEVKKLNDALMKDVQKDISDENNDSLKRVSRGPASAEVEMEPEGKYIEDQKKIDKSNFRQIGPNKW